MKTENLISIQTICIQYKVEHAFVLSLSEYELVEVIRVEEEEYLDKAQLANFERWMRLHYDLEINLEGLDVIWQLLKKIDHLEAEIKMLKLSLPLDQNPDLQD